MVNCCFELLPHPSGHRTEALEMLPPVNCRLVAYLGALRAFNGGMFEPSYIVEYGWIWDVCVMSPVFNNHQPLYTRQVLSTIMCPYPYDSLSIIVNYHHYQSTSAISATDIILKHRWVLCECWTRVTCVAFGHCEAFCLERLVSLWQDLLGRSDLSLSQGGRADAQLKWGCCRMINQG